MPLNVMIVSCYADGVYEVKGENWVRGNCQSGRFVKWPATFLSNH